MVAAMDKMAAFKGKKKFDVDFIVKTSFFV